MCASGGSVRRSMCTLCTRCGFWGGAAVLLGRAGAAAVRSARRPAAMTTLLEIKSSVLRQVQACPTFRRRAEGEPAATNADPPEPAAGAWWVLRAQACTVARPRGSWESGARRGRRAGSPDVWTRGIPSRRTAGSRSWAGGGCVPGARVSGLASPCRKPGDGVEFFAHMRLILKKGEGRQGLPCPEVRMAQSCCPVWASPPAPSAAGPHPSNRLPPSLGPSPL